MATLPATIEAAGGAGGQQNNLATGFSGLTVFRQFGLLIGLAASIAIGFAVVLWSQEPEYRPILSDVDGVTASQAVDVLQGNNIPFKMDARSGAVLVPVEHVSSARLKLAAAGVSNQRNPGFELLDKEQSLGTSQFMESISFRRGLEGELARTIAGLHSVKASRVHLAMPRASVFVRDNRKPSASVFVDLMPSSRLNDEQIQAILNLVAASVPELAAEDVTIVDQRGRLLSDQGQDEEAAMAARQFDYTRKLEELMTRRVQRILEPIVGMGKFNAQVSADLDFTAIEQTAETFNPDLSALRSEQTLDEERSGNVSDGGVPGALANQPPGATTVPEQAEGAEGTAAAGAPGSTRKQATRNFELDRTISHTRHQTGRVRRLSVAVVVDDLTQKNDAGESTKAEWAEEDLDRLTTLVKSAVGYDASRGDLVTVVNSAFVPLEVIETVVDEQPIWEKTWFHKLMKQVAAAILVLILVFMVIRPIMKSLSDVGAQQQALALAAAGATGGASPDVAGAAEATAGGADAAAIPGAQTAPLLPGPGQNYDTQLAAVQGMINDDPQRVAQVMKQWVGDNEE